MKLFVITSAVWVASLGLAAADETPFFGPIPVQFVNVGQDLALDMHRFLEPAGAKLDLSSSGDVEAAFDRVSFQLHVIAKKPGLHDVELTARSGKQSARAILTVAASDSVSGHKFLFKSASSSPQRVFVAGAFNGWSVDKTPLAGPDQNGNYTAELPLSPGRYAYKLVIDGKWQIDPQNPNTEDNGMGDKNSVVVVAASGRTTAPSLFADRLSQTRLAFRPIAERPITKVSAVLETNSGMSLLQAKIQSESLEVEFPAGQTGFVRVVAANSDGLTNVVRCPIGSQPAFLWQDAVMYYAFTDRFADGDKTNDRPVDNPNVAPPANFHGGDLQGIRQKIEEGYFEQLGVNTIWVAPLNQNPDKAYQESPEPHRWYTGYHGYWPVSSTEVDPHIGTGKDLRALIDSAHGHGMKVIADLVLHHVHELHPWWKEHRDWFGTLELPDGRKNLRLWDEQQFTTWFEPYLPSFNFAKAAPVEALIDNSVWWANTYQLDGFRLDAVKHILPSFWWKFRPVLRQKVDRTRKVPMYLVGETFKDRAGIMSFVGPNMLDGQFDFPLYDQIKDTFAQGKGEMTTLDDALASSERIYGKETLMSPLVGNHDKGRFMAYADGDLPDPKIEKEEEVGWKKPPKVDDPANFTKLELAQAFLMSIDGVPMIYYGDEIGMTGAGDPDNRRDMRFGDQLSADEQRVLDNFKKLGAIRRSHPALRGGSRRTVQADHDLLAFVRAQLDDRVLVVFNRGENDKAAELTVGPELADGWYIDELNGEKLQVQDGKIVMTVKGRHAAFVSRSR